MKSTSNYEANKRKISQQTVATNKIVYLFRWELRKRTKKLGIHMKYASFDKAKIF